MNLPLFKHDFKIIHKNKKNVIFVVTLLVFITVYCFAILPNNENMDSFNPKVVSEEQAELAEIQKRKEEIGATGIFLMWNLPVYSINENYYTLRENMLQAFHDKDFNRFIHLRTYFLTLHPEEYLSNVPETLLANSPFPGKDRSHFYHLTVMRYQGYIDNDIPLTYSLIEQKTAVQIIQQFLVSSFAYLIIFCAIYFSCDMITRDRENQTIVQGFPISWYQSLNIKSLAAFTYTMLVLIGVTIFSVIIFTIKHGFGSLSIGMPFMTFEKWDFTLDDYALMPLYTYLAKTILFIPILVYLFIRLNVLLSLIFKNLWVVMITSSLILISEKIYFSRTLRELFGIEISNFPQTYFDFGKVVANDKNYLVNVNTVTFTKGIIVLLISILIIELFVWFVAKIVNKRRFYKT